jgi:cytoskeletal protein RodZ
VRRLGVALIIFAIVVMLAYLILVAIWATDGLKEAPERSTPQETTAAQPTSPPERGVKSTDENRPESLPATGGGPQPKERSR